LFDSNGSFSGVQKFGANLKLFRVKVV
jgi:hypothetical protein